MSIMQIPLSNPDITDIERDAVQEVLRTPQLSLGPRLPQFEQAVARYAGVRHAVAMSSGTAVLHAIVRALGLSKGDFALTTPFSFISTANCWLIEGVEPVFVDIDEETYNMTPERAEQTLCDMPANLRRRVKALAYVDVFGSPADGPGFEDFGRKHGVTVIDDSAEALGSSYLGRMCGAFGDAGLFAFYPNKQITTGEGGVLTTNSDSLALMARSLRNQGRDEGAGWLQHARLGYNYRLSDVNCALGLAQMGRIDDIVARRRQVKAMYDERLAGEFKAGVLIPQRVPGGAEVSPFVYVVRLADSFNAGFRDQLLMKLRERGVACSNYFTPIHLQPHFRELGWRYGDMPVTEKVSERTVALPFFNNLTDSQTDYVAETLRTLLKSV